MRKFIFAANFKCNQTRAGFNSYADALNSWISDEEIIVFPPSCAFLNRNLRFLQGAQNFYPCQNGAFTGEIGLEQLNEFGINCVLIGHSERRQILGESEEFLRAKFEFAKGQNFKIVYCIGESLETRESGKTLEFLGAQLKNIDLNYENLIIAYEPIWAIGTGKSASKAEISEILEFISRKTSAPLLYGGSVNLGNIAEIYGINSCGGVLVGGASLDAQNFINLIKETK